MTLSEGQTNKKISPLSSTLALEFFMHPGLGASGHSTFFTYRWEDKITELILSFYRWRPEPFPHQGLVTLSSVPFPLPSYLRQIFQFVLYRGRNGKEKKGREQNSNFLVSM